MPMRCLKFPLNLYRNYYRARATTLPQTRLLRTIEGKADKEGIYPTIGEVTADLANTMGVDIGYHPSPKSREHLQQLIPQSLSELPPRTMKDSFVVAVIPLSSNAMLQEKYVSLGGEVRMSRFLEDMDMFSVAVVQKYILNPRVKPGMHSPYTIVTALVDRIEFADIKPKVNVDVRISGHVSWVGKTSVEVIVWLDQHDGSTYFRITKAVFLLAIRDAINSKGVVINPLATNSKEEQDIVSSGERRKKYRLLLKQQDLSAQLPTPEEQKVVHDLYRRTVTSHGLRFKGTKLPQGCRWMETCCLSNIVQVYPQHRNLHNTVFGGFLMRTATDLSYSLGLLFTNAAPVLRSISDIQFYNPVSMSELLKMQACVVFTETAFIQIMVSAETWDMSKDIHQTTNRFHFTYECHGGIPQVMPRTYSEAMMYIDGRRHFEIVLLDLDDVYSFEPIHTFEPPKTK